MDELARFLEPTYIRHLPREDAFGNAIRYESWQAGPERAGADHYAIGSAGRDWKWDMPSLRAYSRRGTDGSDCDIVYSDGAFIVYPRATDVLPMAEPAAGASAFDKATALYRANRYADAVPLFAEHLRSHPDDALANARIGMSLAALGRLEEAIPYLLQACTLDGADYQSRGNLALVYEKLGRPDEGIVWARQSDQIKPNDPQILNNLGWVLLRAGHREEAVSIFERAVKLAPDEPRYRENLRQARGR
jgi:Flp pilus assembly protein TadD